MVSGWSGFRPGSSGPHRCSGVLSLGKHSKGISHKQLGRCFSTDRVLCVQEWNEIQFNGVYYNPPKAGAPGAEPTADTSYTFRYPRPPRPHNLRIYECHVGMSSQEPKVSWPCWQQRRQLLLWHLCVEGLCQVLMKERLWV